MDACEQESPTLPFPSQPKPLNFQAIRTVRKGRPETFMARVWMKGDAEICARCEVCTATLGREGKTAMCTHRVAGLVPDSEIEDYRFRPESGARLPRDPRTGTAS